MFKIAEISADLNGSAQFVQAVRLSGNQVDLDTGRNCYMVYSRNATHVEDATPDVLEHMCSIEIGGSLDILRDENPNTPFDHLPDGINLEEPVKETCVSSLEDILKLRESQRQDPTAEDAPMTYEQSEEPSKDDAPLAMDFDDLKSEDSEDLFKGPEELRAMDNIVAQISEVRRLKFFQAVEGLLQEDLTSEVEILRQLGELGETKQILSVLLAQAGITISFTDISHTLKSETRNVIFQADRIESLKYYRYGVSELLRQFEALKGQSTALIDSQKEIQALKNERSAHTATSSLEISRLRDQLQQALVAQTPNEMAPAQYYVSWVVDSVRHWLTVKPGTQPAAPPELPPEYALKACGATLKRTQAFVFQSEASAAAQRARILKHPKNLDALQGLEKLPTFDVLRMGLDFVAV